MRAAVCECILALLMYNLACFAHVWCDVINLMPIQTRGDGFFYFAPIGRVDRLHVVCSSKRWG